jgi:putative colanic acid biosynthesis UDP-glucose lipid carrier transferase
VAAVISPARLKAPAMLEDSHGLRLATTTERRFPAWLSGRVVSDLVLVGYGIALGLLGVCIQPTAAGPDGAGDRSYDPLIGCFVGTVFVLLCILIANIGLRELQSFATLRRLVACFGAAMAIFALFAWSTQTYWSEANGAVLLWLTLGSGLLAVLHSTVARYLRESPTIRQLCARHVAIICGHERTCARFLDLLRAQQDADIRLVGVFHDPSDRRSSRTRPGRTLDELLAYARERRIDEIFLALPWHAERRISALVERLAHLPVDLKLCPDGVGYVQAIVMRERLAGVPVATIRRQPIRDWGRILKRALDLGVSALLLVLLALPMAGLALAIRLESPGPALFRQRRLGFNQGEFEMLKFRTMRHDPRAPLVQARPGDERVTRIGRWLRRTSLDELPQLINVLRGEMSLVGPRPHAVALNAAFMRRIQQYATRYRVRPGITGLAQVYGWRGATDTEEKMAGRVSHDLYYIEHWSLMLDLKILALTVLTGFAHQNAY